MPRYFLELSYKGARYSGFQTQQNALTIQSETEKALAILAPEMPCLAGEAVKRTLQLTGSSRTDAGVHALQNFFHFDSSVPVGEWRDINGEQQFLYKMNAILPDDIVAKRLYLVKDDAHCRFDALARTYHYFLYREKDPFLKERAYYYPYELDMSKLQEAADIIKEYSDFTSFSKRNTQVKTFTCKIMESQWVEEGKQVYYRVRANRFLRGMVRGLTGTMLKVGRGKLSINEFREIVEALDCTRASFAVPAGGLFLIQVEYPPFYFK